MSLDLVRSKQVSSLIIWLGRQEVFVANLPLFERLMEWEIAICPQTFCRSELLHIVWMI